MTTKPKNRQIKNILNFILDCLKEHKFLFIIIASFCLISILTGIIVGAKTHSSYGSLDNFGVVDVTTGGLTSSFFTRLLSMIVISLVLFGCSFSIYLSPIALLFLAYRSYLLGLNICLMIIFYGVSGTVISIIIAFPCQLIALAVMMLFYILMFKTIKDYKCWGGCKTSNQRLKVILFMTIALIAVCLLESLLLALFSAKVILVI